QKHPSYRRAQLGDVARLHQSENPDHDSPTARMTASSHAHLCLSTKPIPTIGIASCTTMSVAETESLGNVRYAMSNPPSPSTSGPHPAMRGALGWDCSDAWLVTVRARGPVSGCATQLSHPFLS